jgi:hypothetical protein
MLSADPLPGEFRDSHPLRCTDPQLSDAGFRPTVPVHCVCIFLFPDGIGIYYIHLKKFCQFRKETLTGFSACSTKIAPAIGLSSKYYNR